MANLIDRLSYGVKWSYSQSDPKLTRIGNTDMHTSNYIQSGMKGAIIKIINGKPAVQYWLDPDDWGRVISKYRSGWTIDMPSPVDGVYTVPNKSSVTKLSDCLYCNLYYGDVKGRMVSYDTVNNTVSMVFDSAVPAGSRYIEAGAVTSGIRGIVMLYIPGFYIKSGTDGMFGWVRISPVNVDGTWEYQPPLWVSPYHATILREVPEDFGYLSTLPVGSAISVINPSTYCRGGNNNSAYDTYLSTDPCRTNLCKPATNVTIAEARTAARKIGAEVLNYRQYKNIYWLYTIEYANFNCKLSYSSKFNAAGYRQGGLGPGVTSLTENQRLSYNGKNPLTPCGFTNSLGNNTGNVSMSTVAVSGGLAKTTFKVPRYRGIENIFGDIWTFLDGAMVYYHLVAVEGSAKNVFFATSNPEIYGSTDHTLYDKIGLGYGYSDGFVGSYEVRETAEIIPQVTVSSGDGTNWRGVYYLHKSSSDPKRVLLAGYPALADRSGIASLSAYSPFSYKKEWTGFRICINAN